MLFVNASFALRYAMNFITSFSRLKRYRARLCKKEREKKNEREKSKEKPKHISDVNEIQSPRRTSFSFSLNRAIKSFLSIFFFLFLFLVFSRSETFLRPEKFSPLVDLGCSTTSVVVVGEREKEKKETGSEQIADCATFVVIAGFYA